MIDGQTVLYGLWAHPAAHSLSPAIHNMSFQLTGQPGAYLAFDVTTATLPAAIQGFKAFHMGGVNLSMPLKAAVIPYLDDLSPRAQQLGAVNTIVNRDGRLYGDSTDGQGFLDAVAAEDIQLTDRRVTVLGAGGAGRAIIAAMVDMAPRAMTIAKRANATFAARQAQLMRWGDQLHVIAYEDDASLGAAIAASDVIVNTTNVGMGADARAPLSAALLEALHPGQVVVDIIYSPLQTPFLRQAEQRGCRTVNGLGLLVHQAAIAFQLWTGTTMPVTQIKTSVNQRLQEMGNSK